MSKHNKVIKVKRHLAYKAGLQNSVPIPKNMSHQDFSKLVNASSPTQFMSLFKQVKTQSNLANLKLNQVLTPSNIRVLGKTIDKAFERVHKNL